MKEKVIREVEQGMLEVLDNAQRAQLHRVLEHALFGAVVVKDESVGAKPEVPNETIAERFYEAKRLEGCSERTIRYYRLTICKMLETLAMPLVHMTTEHLRTYLSDYQEERKCSKLNMDNIRRILSSFFSWLEDENYILKSPVRRIHKIRMECPVKEAYTDEALEQMRDNCGSVRDLAIIDLLSSTGMRVGELVGLNRADIDFENRECVVFGKGGKERPAYFDARTKIHLKNYLGTRSDDNPALFVSLASPHSRLKISGVEIRLRRLGRRLGINRVHPHKFRRTMATRAIDKGMPVEQVQRLLGHSKIDTTMQYALVNQSNVKNSHRRFIA